MKETNETNASRQIPCQLCNEDNAEHAFMVMSKYIQVFQMAETPKFSINGSHLSGQVCGKERQKDFDFIYKFEEHEQLKPCGGRKISRIIMQQPNNVLHSQRFVACARIYTYSTYKNK